MTASSATSELSLLIEAGQGVIDMRCTMCGNEKQEGEMVGTYCGRCDHVYGDVMMGLQAEYEPHVV